MGITIKILFWIFARGPNIITLALKSKGISPARVTEMLQKKPEIRSMRGNHCATAGGRHVRNVGTCGDRLQDRRLALEDGSRKTETSISQVPKPWILTRTRMNLEVDLPQNVQVRALFIWQRVKLVKEGPAEHCGAQTSDPQNWEITNGCCFEVFVVIFYGSSRTLIHIVKIRYT